MRHARLLAPLGLIGVTVGLAHPLLLGGVLFRRDIHLLWHANHDAFVRALAAGVWPLWGDALGFGRTLVGNPQSLVLYPPHWLAGLLSFPHYCAAFVLAHLAWGAAGAYALGRRLGLSREAATLAAAAFVASGPFVSSFEMLSLLAGTAWLPWTVAAALALAHRPGPRRAVLGGLVGAAQILAGSPGLALMAAVGATVAFVAGGSGRGEPPRRRFGSLALAVIVALGLSSVQWLAALETAAASGRHEMSSETRGYWSLHPLAATETLLPVRLSTWPLAPGAREALFESREPLLASVYLGLPGLLLAIAAPRRRRALAAGLAGLLLLALLLALGRHTPLLAGLATALRPLGLLRYPVKAMLPAALLWSLILGLGLDAWRDGDGKRHRWAIACGLLAGLGLGAAVATPWLLAGPFRSWLPTADADLRAALAHPLAFRLLLAAAASTLAALGWTSASARRRSLTAAALAVVTVGELVLLHSRLNPTAPPGFYAYRSPLVEKIDLDRRVYVYDYYGIAGKSEEHLGRANPLVPASSLPPGPVAGALALRAYMLPGSGVPWGLRYAFDLDVARLEPAEVSRLNQLLRLVEGTPSHLRLLELGGVGTVISLHDLAPDGLVRVGELPDVLVEPIGYWRVPRPLPRAFVVGGRRVGAGLDGPRRLLDPGFDPRLAVVLAEDPERAPPPGFEGEARIVRARPGELAIEVQLTHAGHLVVLDSFAPGWRAQVDGRPAAVERADVAFRAVALPSGAHHVELRYRPRSLLAGGLAASLAAVLALVALLVDRREPPTDPC